MQAVIYARVSSTGDRQSTERQVMDLTDYASRNGLTVQPLPPRPRSLHPQGDIPNRLGIHRKNFSKKII